MRRSVKNILRAGALCLILLACALFTTALAAGSDVTYVQYSWEEGSGLSSKTLSQSEYKLIEDNTTEWSTGWYVASGSVEINSRVTVSGDVHLILTDGCELTVAGITVNSGNSLTIYGQNAGSGKLISVAGSLEGAGIGGKANTPSGSSDNHSGDITIHGGNITATGNWGAGIGGSMRSGSCRPWRRRYWQRQYGHMRQCLYLRRQCKSYV